MVPLRRNPFLGFVLEVAELYFNKRVARSAAELAYFLILTFFPAIICINAVIGTLHLNVISLLDQAAEIIPYDAMTIIKDYVNYITGNQSITLLAAGGTMLLFSASAAMRSLMNVMSDIYGQRSYSGIWQIVASVVFSVLFLLAIYLSVVVVLTGNWLFRLLDDLLHHIPALSWVRLPWEWQWMRFLILFCFLLMVVMLIYKATAPRGRPRPPVLTGAFLSTTALVLSSILFSYFLGLSSRYSLVYGSLTSVVILLIWLYLCGTIVILGSCVNCVWYGRKKQAQRDRH